MIKAYILRFSTNTTKAGVDVLLEDDSGPYTLCANVVLNTGSTDTLSSIVALVEPAVDAFIFSNLAVHPASIQWLFTPLAPLTLSAAPQAAIANSTNNLPTNFNLVSGILGVANGLNDANTAQNDMATKFNTLLSELRTLGLIS